MTNKLTVLDLFSGVGGFSLGLEKTGGFETVAFCEKDETCRKVLRKHWPRHAIFQDVETLTYKELKSVSKYANDAWDLGLLENPPSPRIKKIDVICGGFPCQDISVGGRKKGIINGARSSLWKQYKRLIDEIKPRYAIIENVERLRKNGLGVVLSDLFEIGYDAEWHCVTARRFGLPHQRDRAWIIAYPRVKRCHERAREKRHLQTDKKRKSETVHSDGEKCESELGEVRPILSRGALEAFVYSLPNQRAPLSEIRRVTDGVPLGLDETARQNRIKQLGNAVVPVALEFIGSRILEIEGIDPKQINSNL